MLDSALEPSYNLSENPITAMDTEIDSEYGKWFNPPEWTKYNYSVYKKKSIVECISCHLNGGFKYNITTYLI